MSRALALALVACGGARAYDNAAPNARLPTLGWSSWIALGPGAADPVFDYCDDFSIRAAADAFVDTGLYAAGYRHFHLDDCWAGPRNATGYLTPEADHFPNGMKAVIDYVHAKGMSFGLYTCSGLTTCVGGRPGSYGHWQQDADVFAEWGVDWVKQDYCNVPSVYKNDPQPLYSNMSRALNATGRAMAFSMCEWGLANPWEWGDAIAQSWRMHGDHTAVWSDTKEVIAASAAIPVEYTGRPYGWNDMDMLETGCGVTGANCAHANGREPNLTAIEYKTEFSMWAISASPLQITARIMNCTQPPVPNGSVSLVKQLSKAACVPGVSFGLSSDNTTMWTIDCRGDFMCNDAPVTCNINGTGVHTCPCAGAGPVTCVGWLTDLQKEILLNTEVLAINQDVTPQGTPIKSGDLTVWARMLTDGSAAVAFYNQEDASADIHVDFAALGGSWGAGTKAAVRDLWAHADLGVVTGRYPAKGSVSVLPHQTHLVRLTPQ